MNIAHAIVARLAYVLPESSRLYPIFFANFSIKGIFRKDNANIKHIPVFIKTGYNFRKMLSLYIINPNANNITHIKIQMFLFRVKEMPATANNNKDNARNAMCFFNAKNTING